MFTNYKDTLPQENKTETTGANRSAPGYGVKIYPGLYRGIFPNHRRPKTLFDHQLVEQPSCTRELVDDEQHVADIDRYRTLQIGLESHIARHGFPVAVESQPEQCTPSIHHGRTRIAARNIAVGKERHRKFASGIGITAEIARRIKFKKDGYIENNGYIISWCVGHLVGLAEAAAYGEQYKKWDYDSLPILPQDWKYTIAADKGKQFKILKGLMHRADVTEVINACDAGREGELIFRFVYETANCKKPMRRLWISSMETEAIRQGFESLKDGRDYAPLFASALCRAKADWIIGINATRLFSCLYSKTLNVGRVQTPTLKMLVDRDVSITNFKKEKYYVVCLDLPGAEAASAKIRAATEAAELKAACEASAAVCLSITKEKKTVAPPKLFDLTSLQREANRIYGYTAKQTLDLAQSLYEKKLLTYPRTDSSFLTDDMEATAAGIAALLLNKLPFMQGANYTANIARVLDSKKVSDHHAIIPTMELAKSDLAALPESERNILTLAGVRLLTATAEPHIFEAVTAVFSCADREFTAKGKTVLCGGWKELEARYRASLKKKPDSDDEENALVLDVPPFTEGQRFEKPAARVTEHETTPPKPHNEDICCERGIRNHP